MDASTTLIDTLNASDQEYMLKRGVCSVQKWYVLFDVDFIETFNQLDDEKISFLDICCGYGNLVEELGRSPVVFGIHKTVSAFGIDKDWQPEFFEKLELQNEPVAHIIQSNAENLPFEDHAFDITNMMAGMAYIDDGIRALFEQYRVTKIGGHGFVYIQQDSTDIAIDTSVTELVHMINEYFGAIIFEIHSFDQQALNNLSEDKKPYYEDSKLITFTKADVDIYDFPFNYKSSKPVPPALGKGHAFEQHWRYAEYDFAPDSPIKNHEKK